VVGAPVTTWAFAFTQIDVPGAQITQALGINDSGQIVGLFVDATGLHGFLRDTDGSFTPIDVPGADRTEAHGINDSGQIVGVSSFGGFLRDTDGSFTPIDHLAFGINDNGQIVGTTG
jgi:uncharacterized membrane protein